MCLRPELGLICCFTVWPWASYLNSLSFKFFICNVVSLIVLPHRIVKKIHWNTKYKPLMYQLSIIAKKPIPTFKGLKQQWFLSRAFMVGSTILLWVWPGFTHGLAGAGWSETALSGVWGPHWYRMVESLFPWALILQLASSGSSLQGDL